MILGRGPYEMASLSNSAITKRDVMISLVSVLYRETVIIGNLFIYTFWSESFVLYAPYLIFKILRKRNRNEWFSVTFQKNKMFGYAALKTAKLARTSFIKEIKVYSSYIIA